MNHIYKPSGKISLLFIPVYVIMISVVALCAFVCVFCIYFSPYSLFDVLIFILSAIGIGKYSALWCVKAGKIRNPVFSMISGMILALFYSYFLIVFDSPVKKIFATKAFDLPDKSLSGFLQAFHWEKFLNTLSDLNSHGVTVTGKGGGYLFGLPGNLCMVLMLCFCIVQVIFFASVFYQNSHMPFDELLGKWMKKRIFAYSVPEEGQQFISKLLLGDYFVLSHMKPLYEVDADYCKVSLYISDSGDECYVSLSYMENCGGTRYKENKLVEYLRIDRVTGGALLSRLDDVSAADKLKKKSIGRMAVRWGIRILVIAAGVITFYIKR